MAKRLPHPAALAIALALALAATAARAADPPKGTAAAAVVEALRTSADNPSGLVAATDAELMRNVGTNDVGTNDFSPNADEGAPFIVAVSNPIPSKVAPRKTQKWTIWVTNVSLKPIPAGTKVSVWANKEGDLKCGEGGATKVYKLKAMKPYQTVARKIRIKIPGPGTVATFLYKDSNFVPQPSWTVSAPDADAKGKPLKYAEIKFWKGPPDTRMYANLNPQNMPAGSTFSGDFILENVGTAPSEPVPLGVWPTLLPPDFPSSLPIVPVFCDVKPVATGQVPKIAPRKTGTVTVGGLTAAIGETKEYLTANSTMFAALDICGGIIPFRTTLNAYPYRTTPVKGSYLAGVHGKAKGQEAFTVLSAPAKAKAGSTTSLKVTLKNTGTGDGAPSTVAIWISPKGGGAQFTGEPCNYTDTTFTATLASPTVSVGSTSVVTIPDVPVPSAPGWYTVTVAADSTCVSGAQKVVEPQLPFNALQVV
ncbi:hypothetical protein Rsub_00860 [Raphidocelis subcapitata]|uniref:CARDB domain-containing protein n=1 Tax=Raphidocelis subcapitata TaxID=307507 RepID=A0A2V0NL81_9CHLO|nr:hypothetical protein Rsub_00860 [Raphidocelis subcapitata]|eukprot:GBF88148.1 hypothetical protein Rsub_00860 [Raphidocelis subcapitata]